MHTWKALNEFRFIAIILITISASACTSNKDSSDQKAPPPAVKHQVYQGPLYKAFRNIQESKDRSICDKKLSNIQSTLIEALDLKSNDILKSSLAQDVHPDNFIPFSKSYLIDTPKMPSRKGWRDEPYSWERAYRSYQEYKGPKNAEFWQKLDTYVRSLITDDRNRVVFKYNLSLSHDQVEKLPQLKEVIEACKTDTRCTLPRWTEDQLEIISKIPSYSQNQSEIENARFNWKKRDFIQKFFDRIDSDFNFHHDDFNEMITHRKINGKHIYSLPIEASNLAETDRLTLEKSISSVWNNEENQVELNWKNSPDPTNYFRFLFSLEPNNRSYVLFGLREIHLFPFTAIRTVAHEFGHVLGFDDHYYTVWDPEKCEYHAQYNEEDIMSGSITGDVTEQEWQTMFDQYGIR